MSLVKLIIWIILTLIGFWLLRVVFNIATWAVDLTLIIATVLAVLWLVWQYMESNKKAGKK